MSVTFSASVSLWQMRVAWMLLSAVLMVGSLVCPTPAQATLPAFLLSHESRWCNPGELIRPAGMGKPAALILRAWESSAATNCVYMDSGGLNNNPNAYVFVTSNWNSAGSSGVYNNHPVGAWYDAAAGMWAVVNLDSAPLPANASFNVMFTSNDPKIGFYDQRAAVHMTTIANTNGARTYLNHPLANANPYAQVLVSAVGNPAAGVSVDSRVTGVWYDTKVARWAIVNQDGTTMPLGVAFHIYAANDSAVVQRATPGNTAWHSTRIDHPSANGNANAVLLVTPNLSPGGSSGSLNNHVTGVWYDVETSRWAIFNQDFTPMPTNAAFTMLVFK